MAGKKVRRYCVALASLVSVSVATGFITPRETSVFLDAGNSMAHAALASAARDSVPGAAVPLKPITALQYRQQESVSFVSDIKLLGGGGVAVIVAAGIAIGGGGVVTVAAVVVGGGGVGVAERVEGGVVVEAVAVARLREQVT